MILIQFIQCYRYPDNEQLQSIYGAYLQAALSSQLEKHQVWGNPSKVRALASTMVQVYEQVRQRFTADNYSHYLFTPRDLTRWVLGLLRYTLSGGK